MRIRRATLLALLALACAAPAAHAQTTTGTGNAVEPVPGQAAPAPTGATTVPPVATTPPAVTTTPPATTAPAAAPAQPAAKDEGGKVSWYEIAAMALGAILLAVVITLLLWRVRGWDPRWLKRWRHAVAEAGWRLSLGWAEFRDFVRLGR